MSVRGTSSAAFLNKLWKLVNDPLTDDLIRWSPSQNTRGIATSEGNQNLNNILMELQKVKMNQDSMKLQISELKKENDMLWRQYTHVRMKFSKQQKVIEKLVRFMLSMMDRRKELLSKKILQLPMEGEADSSSAGHRNTLKLKYEPKQLLSITGPEEPSGAVIHEVTHLHNNEDPAALLDTIFQSYSDSIPQISGPLEDNSEMLSDNIQNISTAKNPKLEPVDALLLDELEGEEFSNNPNVPSSFIITTSPMEALTTTVATTGPKWEQKYSPVFSDGTNVINENSSQPIQFITTNYLPSSTFSNEGTVTVQSPNGTILQDSSPPLSPEMMEMVDPSLVNPNIIVTYPKEQLQNQQQQNSNIFKKPSSSSSYSSSKIGSKVVSNKKMNKSHSGKLPIGNITAVSLPKQRRGKSEANVLNDKLIDKISDIYNLLFSYSSPKENKSENKSEGKLNAAQQNYTIFPSQRQTAVKSVPEATILPSANNNANIITTNSDSNYLNNQDYNSDNFKVSLANRSLSRDELENHVDEVQSKIDSLKELFQSSNINLDSSALLSLFNIEDDPLIPIPESEPSHSGVVGNEVSLYTPYHFDDEAEGINFSSLIDDEEEEERYSSPAKKQKLVPYNKEEGFETPQPHQMEFGFRNS
ncbi:Heat shock factor protein 1 [Armadillidium nasatum]|uniref:Heat shock factor protein 1 n=1 Tax=Armadillidium nasatum TaxID=96803 RepID=A0A5N5SLL0_9CRUS|nr:Heat shock factor protein 1 [Armadillidium nasatum]